MANQRCTSKLTHMNLKNKTVLVTGGAGFIGSYMTKALLEKGARVVIVDNLSTGKKENVNKKAKFYQMDLADAKLEAVFKKEKPDIVFHYAFNVLVPKSIDDPIMDAQSIIASLNTIKLAYRAQVKKFIFSSSGFVYGNTENRPTREDEPIMPITPYVVSKHAVENYLKYYRMTFGLPYVTLRFAAVYGPGQVTGAMADYIRKLRANAQADIWGDGSKTRDYVFIDDIVRANLLALDVPNDFADPTFNLGTGKETDLNTLYKTIAKLLGKEAHPIYHPDRKGEQMRYCLSPKKIGRVLGWKPNVTLKEGLLKVLAYSAPKR